MQLEGRILSAMTTQYGADGISINGTDVRISPRGHQQYMTCGNDSSCSAPPAVRSNLMSRLFSRLWGV